MAFGAGKNAFFSLDDSGGTPRTLSTYIGSIDVSMDLADLATTALGKNSVCRITGLADGTASITGMFDSTYSGYLTGAYTALRAGTVTSLTYSFGPAGNTGGYVKITGECVLTNLSFGAAVDGLQELSFEIAFSDDATVTTF